MEEVKRVYELPQEKKNALLITVEYSQAVKDATREIGDETRRRKDDGAANSLETMIIGDYVSSYA